VSDGSTRSCDQPYRELESRHGQCPRSFAMSNMNETKQEVASGDAVRAASTERGGVAANDGGAKPAHDVQVHVDYISADEPIHEKFPPETTIAAIKQWAREQFVPQPPSDKAYYLNDDKTRHRFTADEEQQTLAQRGYENAAHFRLNEEQAAGAVGIGPRD
jgi:hypothetical protein